MKVCVTSTRASDKTNIGGPRYSRGVTFLNYSAHTKTVNNEGTLYLFFGVNLSSILTEIP